MTMHRVTFLTSFFKQIIGLKLCQKTNLFTWDHVIITKVSPKSTKILLLELQQAKFIKYFTCVQVLNQRLKTLLKSHICQKLLPLKMFYFTETLRQTSTYYEEHNL